MPIDPPKSYRVDLEDSTLIVVFIMGDKTVRQITKLYEK